MTPTFDAAARRVADDVRRTSRDLADVEALVQAYLTTYLADVPPDEPVPPDASPVERSWVEARNAGHAAWRVVLQTLARGPTRADLERLVERLTRDEFVRLTTLEECWILLIQRRHRA